MLTVNSTSLAFLLVVSMSTSGALFASSNEVPGLQSAQAASEQAVKPVSKTISLKELEKHKSITVTVDEDGVPVKYEGVALRSLLAEMLPEFNLDVMKDWKRIAAQELVMEVTGKDGYPGLVTALEVAMNKAGDRFLLATHRDGKLIESGVKLVCKSDTAHTRWVHEAVLLRIVGIPRAAESEYKRN